MISISAPNKSFTHGIHPPESKDSTKDLAIRQFPFAPVMIVLLSQHTGNAAIPIVREGQEVIRGQIIAEADGFMSVTMHAPASGIVKKIGLAPNNAGPMTPAIYIQPFPGSSQEVTPAKPCDYESATKEEIINAIQHAGIVGLGGAAFPTHVKLKIPEGKKVDTFIVNGVECEPFLTTDHRVMLEQVNDIFVGVRYILKVTGAQKAIIGIEANKMDAAQKLKAAIPKSDPVSVEVVKVKYPQGAEKMLITALLGREIPSGGLPADAGVVVCNVATTAEIGRLLPVGRGIIERVITITGPGIGKKGNYLIPIGTPLRFALDQVGLKDDANRVVLGGPMMGPALANLDVPITKGVSGILVLTEQETNQPEKEYACIKCAYCVDACPLFLNPSRLGILAKKSEYEIMNDKFYLMDCFECGCCSYVCPSNIPLVQYFRVAKGIIQDYKS